MKSKSEEEQAASKMGLFRLSRICFQGKLGPTKTKGPLNTKRAPSLKKGYGSVGLGVHTKKGFFHINTMLIPKFQVPDLTGFHLKPYVSRRTPVINQGPKKYWRHDPFNS